METCSDNLYMDVTISCYKPSGKWYASKTIHAPNIDLRSSEFIIWLKDNLPAKIGPGSIYVIQSTDEDLNNGHFHNRLYHYEQLFSNQAKRMSRIPI